MPFSGVHAIHRISHLSGLRITRSTGVYRRGSLRGSPIRESSILGSVPGTFGSRKLVAAILGSIMVPVGSEHKANIAVQFKRPMPVLPNSRHERFVQSIVAGGTATAAYTAAGYSRNGAAQSAQRLLRDVKIQARKAELEEKVAVTFVAGQIAEREYRMGVYQDSVDRLRALIDDRAVAYRDVTPGGATGLLVQRVRSIRRGKKNIVIHEYAVDVTLLAELRTTLKQAAIEAGNCQEEKRQPHPNDGLPDVSHMTVEQLYAERRALAEARRLLDAPVIQAEE
jgi:hypothetical protein